MLALSKQVYCVAMYVLFSNIAFLLYIAPDGPPLNVSVQNYSSYSLMVKWLPPEVPNGIIIHYYFYINYTNGTYEKRQVGVGYAFYLLEDLKPHQVVGIKISGSTIGGEGPASEQEFARTNEAGAALTPPPKKNNNTIKVDCC